MQLAALMTVCWIAWSLYELNWSSTTTETRALSAGARYLEDGQLQDALSSFEAAMSTSPNHSGALLGKAQSLMQLGTEAIHANRKPVPGREDALAHYRIIAMHSQPWTEP
ncbi:tetratricopeptide repeat protein [Solemya velesiana gill symbiont]|nr:tetratricopeptide repeat protein [Solemya velesiana gill symbiont]